MLDPVLERMALEIAALRRRIDQIERRERPVIMGTMYGHNMSQTVVVTNPDTYYQVGGGLSGGLCRNTTFQNSREILIAVAGDYWVVWQMSVTAGSPNEEVEGEVMINSTAQNNTSSHSNVSSANRPDTIDGNGALTLAVGDVVSLAVSNHTSGADIVVEHANLLLVKL